jgi:hypothetical protein
MTSELLALADADVSWHEPEPAEHYPPATEARIDALARSIEEQISDGEEVLEDAPKFSLGQRIRSRPVNISDLIDA